MPIKIVPKEDKKTYDEARSKFLKDYVPSQQTVVEEMV
jgi:hypothetical protein